MSRIEGKRVPIPPGPGIFTKRGNGPKKETLVFRIGEGNSAILIGYVCKDDTSQMEPNDSYKELYKEEWKKRFGAADLLPLSLRFGPYAAVKAIVDNNGLITMLGNAFGVKNANKILDYSMYSILFQCDITSQYESRMCDQVLFNNKVLSDSTYSNLFERGISKEDVLAFKKAWALHCKEIGIESVWLCIDGSNEDCKCKGVEIAEKGKAKSGKNVNIVSFTYAVTENGFPVTFKLYRGGLVDPKAMKDILGFLSECGIKVKGVILDRGYCTASTIKYLDANKIEYIIMIKGEPKGYKDVVEEYKRKIKHNAVYFVPKTNLFAAQKLVQLFEDYKKFDNVTIFYDFKNGAERLDTFITKVNKELIKVESLIAEGKEPSIDSKFADVLELTEDKKSVHIRMDEFQKHLDETGIYGVVHSEAMTADKVHAFYSSRNVSEKQYNFVKTQLGYGTGAHVHFTAGTEAKYAVGFISTIIRFELEEAAKKANMATTSYIRELNLIQVERINKSFFYNHVEKGRQINLMKQLSDKDDYLDDVVKEINVRLNGYTRPVIVKRKKPGPKPKAKPTVVVRPAETATPKKRGPAPGFKRGLLNKDGTARQKPGPKLGSKKTDYNKDGSLRQKPGPKLGSHHGKENVS